MDNGWSPTPAPGNLCLFDESWAPDQAVATPGLMPDNPGSSELSIQARYHVTRLAGQYRPSPLMGSGHSYQ